MSNTSEQEDALALSDLHKAIELAPNNAAAAEYYSALGNFYRRNGTSEDGEAAYKAYAKAIELAPNNAVAAKYYSELGYYYCMNGTPEDEEMAYEAYTKAIALEPKNAEWYIERARQTYHWTPSIFDEEERPQPTFFTEDNALKDYTSAIKLDRKNEDAFKRRAELYSDQASKLKRDDQLEQAEQLYNKARADYNSALKVNKKDSAEAYMRRANIQFDLAYLLPYDDKVGRQSYFEKQIEEYACAIALEPNDEYLYLRRASTYDRIASNLPCDDKDGRKSYYEMAIAECTKAIAIAPGKSNPYSERAGYYASVGEHDKQLADLTKVIELEPDSYFSYTRRARFYEEMKQYEKAIADQTKAIELDASDGLYRERAKIYQAWGQTEQALADYTKAIELAPDSTYSYSARADAYYEFGEYEKAIADYTEAIRFDSGGSLSWLYFHYTDRARAYEAIGETALAEADRKAAKENYGMDETALAEASRKTAEANQLIRIGLDAYKLKDFAVAEESFLQAYNLDNQQTNARNNLAYMKRRGETQKTTIPIADLLSRDSQDGYVIMNLALCYAKGFECKKSWGEAVSIVSSTEADFSGAKSWWSDESVVGDEESNAVLLLILLHDKAKGLPVNEVEITERMAKARSDGYAKVSVAESTLILFLN